MERLAHAPTRFAAAALRTIAATGTIAVAASLPGNALAHTINPLENKYTQHAHPTAWQRIAEPVHEDITQRARACAAAADADAQLPLVCDDAAETPAGDPRGNKYDSLIRGVWWNDDPNQLLFAGRQVKFLSWMHDAGHIAKYQRNWKGEPAEITPGYYMTYRGHYGDLQFLHAMASRDGEPAAETRAHLLDWAAYAYAVATGRIDPDTPFAQLDAPFVRGFFANRPGWTTEFLFAPKYKLSDAQHGRRMALGALLHTVQDSYSAAHAARDLGPSARCPAGRIRQFYAYNHQDPELHGQADKRAGWRSAHFSAAQNPVNASATVLAMAARNADWDLVRRYLADTVFCIDDDAEAASAGPYRSR